MINNVNGKYIRPLSTRENARHWSLFITFGSCTNYYNGVHNNVSLSSSLRTPSLRESSIKLLLVILSPLFTSSNSKRHCLSSTLTFIVTSENMAEGFGLSRTNTAEPRDRVRVERVESVLSRRNAQRRFHFLRISCWTLKTTQCSITL